VADDAQVIVEKQGGVGWVTFNRPDQLNVLTRPLLEGLLSALEVLGDDSSVLVVVLMGSGRAFSAGGNLAAGLNEITGIGPLAHQTSELRRFMRISQLLVEMPKPTIAAINGACAGGSLGVACAADIRIASEKAVFASAFLTAGVSGDFAGSWGLSRAVGPGVARELYLTGRRVDAKLALQLGLVSEVVPSDQLHERARSLALEFTQRPPLAIRAIKEIFNSMDVQRFHHVLELEARSQVALINSDDATEARMAFLEKRPARFLGS
jgi:2-(1,2-epoxy-1,2-dihydrophenyl)acetyl-CoA isomerase